MEMNDNVRTWLRDLRSGEYAQGKGQLVDLVPPERHYCCLGVACVNAIVPDPFWDERSALYDRERYQLGLSHNDMDQLMSLNDEHGFSFSEIADVIEEAAISGCHIAEVCRDLAAYEQ